ncbi:c-type cytochrome biogenesis protein CcsB [Nakamurella endophytica]|uniref:Cytochrome c biogenesis protein n=1 Tax=Nakamurella endophytica TaxID=1748367 RepID=A0A917T0M3_9ACTN|nr:c-type cytochrome biogenesis protein CcsB [Nakamurella endophytica]GGM04015.1 cytochrome c biogenesis protein [Nakamurella endophytica]
MVNESLAHLSDLAFECALAGYIVALVCFGIEFAAHRGGVPTEQEQRSAELRASRRSGGVAVLDRGAATPPAIGRVTDDRRGTAPMWLRFGRAGVVVTVVGFAAHLLSLVTRGLAAHRVPWGNMYEFSAMICAAAVAGFLFVLLRWRTRTVGFFVMIPVVILMYVAQSVLYAAAGTLVPALHSSWLVIHVLAVSLSSGVLMLSGVASVLYLLRSRYERKLAAEREWAEHHLHGVPDAALPDAAGTPGGPEALVTQRSRLAALPSLATLDRLAYRSAIVAFPVFTFAVIAGAMWANVAWGRYWGWDPKETCAFVTWVCYAAYLHARSTAGWRGTRAAWISVLGFVSMIFNLFVINLVVSGLHSYAGLN